MSVLTPPSGGPVSPFPPRTVSTFSLSSQLTRFVDLFPVYAVTLLRADGASKFSKRVPRPANCAGTLVTRRAVNLDAACDVTIAVEVGIHLPNRIDEPIAKHAVSRLQRVDVWLGVTGIEQVRHCRPLMRTTV